MSRCIVLAIYNLLLPIGFVLAFPSWVLKMRRRGGFGTGLEERLGKYDRADSDEIKGGVYIHAVSVGEVFIALKLIRQWLVKRPDEHFVLVPTTATGHAVARDQAPEGVRVIYSPVDFGFLVRKTMRRFQPKLVVLMESELWPNLLNCCDKMEIPVALANARLSARSERRYSKLKSVVSPIFDMVGHVLVQEERDIKRWESIGMAADRLIHTGSIKFDHTGGGKPKRREAFAEILTAHGGGKAVVMAMSTFAGEEKAIAEALMPLRDEVFFVVVPRHMERRTEVCADLQSVGYTSVLRSSGELVGQGPSCLVVDSTGELRDWTAHADIAIIGKSWIGKGGQNPTEAIAAKVPVIVGPRMDNFEPLVTVLVENGGLLRLETTEAITAAVEGLLQDGEMCKSISLEALQVLTTHDGAVARSILALEECFPTRKK